MGGGGGGGGGGGHFTGQRSNIPPSLLLSPWGAKGKIYYHPFYSPSLGDHLTMSNVKYTTTPFTLPPWGAISQAKGQIYHHPFYSPVGGPSHMPTVKYTTTPFTLLFCGQKYPSFNGEIFHKNSFTLSYKSLLVLAPWMHAYNIE